VDTHIQAFWSRPTVALRAGDNPGGFSEIARDSFVTGHRT
jgi:hypothetical protein